MPGRIEAVSVAVTGSSGFRVAARLVEVLSEHARIAGVIVTRGALEVARLEEDLDEERAIEAFTRYGPVYMEDDFTSPLASSSSQPDAMIIAPASMKTVGLLAHGIPSNLVTRAALAILRLGRKLVVAPRETPLGVAELKNLLILAEMGALIVPMTLSFYNKPRSLQDSIDFVVGKILDVLGIEANIYRRWNP